MIKTKIICTIGPASNNYTTIRKMAQVGMDVIRINFSHGTHAEHLEAVNLVREFNQRYRRAIKILGDLEGYRIRVGRLSKPIDLKRKQIVWLVQKDIIGDKDLIPFDCNCRLKNIKTAPYIYIDDGNIVLAIKGLYKKKIKCEVVIGGLLQEHKGINIPGADLDFPSLTEKDKEDLEFCIKNKFNFIAQSFVRDGQDILKIKEFMPKELDQIKIIAKIENQQALKNLERIIKVSDGIMVARGDLGISVPIYKIPIIQKEIIKKCKYFKKFSIVATQMLESMVKNPRPTRAEVTDVANAILDGADFVMLSAETAIGSYPVEAVRIMNKIIGFTENYIKSNNP